MTKRVYLDHAATTPVRPEVLEEMLPLFREVFGNPSSVYAEGREAKAVIEKARERVAKAIGAAPNEIFFTGGGTEADNWAIKGVAHAKREKGNHIITTTIEHHGILHTCQSLEKQGFRVTYLPVDEDGLVSPQSLREAITDDTILISIMYANNEIGTIQPIEELATVAHERGVLFHTDAVQAIGAVPIDVKAQGIDLLSLSAHKFYGPKGIGALYIKRGTTISNLIDGGAQERHRRAGTENTAAIAGLGKAIEMATADIPKHNERLITLRDRLIHGILEKIPHARLNGHAIKRLPGNVNISFEFIEGESLLLLLDMKGISASSGSACTSGSLDPSHVLLAIGLPHEIAHGSLRLTLGDVNDEADVDTVLAELPLIVGRLREMSPLYADRKGAPSYV